MGARFEDQLRQQGLTMEAFKRELLSDMIAENLMAKGVSISDEEMRKRFEAQKSNFTQPEQVQISQITVDSEESMKKVKNELGPTAQFSVVATTYSKDPFAQQGGRVPFPLTRQGMPGSPISQEAVGAAFKLKAGEISDPIKSGANWVFVKLEEKIEAKSPKFEDLKPQLRSMMRREKAQAGGQAQQIQQTLFNAFRTAKVEVSRPEYKQILDQVQAAGAAAGGGAPGGAPPGVGADGHGPGDGHDHGAPGAGGGGMPPPAPPGG
jgi:parvulin-like peptidyl-prolyl isomerase